MRRVSNGYDLLQNLLRMLPELKYAVSADIEKFFLQLCAVPIAQHFLRFLRGEPLVHVNVFQHVRHMFTVRDSPTCATFALNQTAPILAKHIPKKLLF